MVKLIKSATEFELSPTLATNELVAQRRAEGKKVLHLGFGESPFPVHPRLEKELQDQSHLKQYLPTAGLKELRDAVLEYYKDKAGIDPEKYDVMIAPGSKLILYALQMAVEGDLLMPVPSWVSYAPQAVMLHTSVIPVPVTLDDAGYHIDADTLVKTIADARAEGKNPSKIILNYPNNPTGLTIPDAELEALAEVCVREDILIISDEIYGLVNFDGVYRSITKYNQTHTVISSGLSKQLSLGGWRIGVGLVPKAVDGLYELMRQIASEMWSCVPAPIQAASVEAYKGHEDVEDYIRDCADIHACMNKFLAERLRGAGVDVSIPQGAFYCYPDFAPFKGGLAGAGVKTSKELAAYLLQSYGVAALPGIAFGAEEDVLTLRLAACDYNGAEVYKAYKGGETLDEDFIKKHAPNIYEVADVFEQFVADISAGQKAAQAS